MDSSPVGIVNSEGPRSDVFIASAEAVLLYLLYSTAFFFGETLHWQLRNDGFRSSFHLLPVTLTPGWFIFFVLITSPLPVVFTRIQSRRPLLITLGLSAVGGLMLLLLFLRSSDPGPILLLPGVLILCSLVLVPAWLSSHIASDMSRTGRIMYWALIGLPVLMGIGILINR